MEPQNSSTTPAIDAAGSPARGLLVARQPIYDAGLEVQAYELIIRTRDGGGQLDAADGTATTAMVRELGPALLGGKTGFVKASREYVLNGGGTMFPPGRVVTQITPAAGSDEFLVDAVRELVTSGYEVALEGFSFSGEIVPLLDVVSTVKVDVAAFSEEALASQVRLFEPYGRRLLAHNVDSHEDFERCLGLGFELFQGHFFCTPKLESTHGEIQSNSLNRMRLIGSLQDPDVEIAQLQDIISTDVGLSFKLLQLVNSAFFALPREIESIRDAIMLLGIKNIRRWATLMALTENDDKPHELLVTGLVRARMCELVAEAAGERDTDAYFTTGLFSVVDALMDASMVEVLAQLPFAEDIVAALLRYEGAKGEALRAVLAYEQGNIAELNALPAASAPLSELYARSVEWAGEAGGGLEAKS